jgi:hypothetical protein
MSDSPTSTSAPGARVRLAIGLVAGAGVLFQLVLTRVFSFTLWHHLAFMIISVALLGFAVSGVVLRLRARPGADPAVRASWAALGFAVSLVAACSVVARMSFDPMRLAQEPAQMLSLALAYGVLLVPFAFAGLAVISLLDGYVAGADRLYGSDLIGAGLGCVVAVAAIQKVGAEGALFLAAAAAATGALLLAQVRQTQSRPQIVAAAGVALGFALCAPAVSGVLPRLPGASKAMRAVLDPVRYPDARIAHTEWNAISRIDVVERSASVSWIVNTKTRPEIPSQTLIVIDGDAATPILPGGDPAALRFLGDMVSAAPLAAFRPKHTLVIGAGGGVDVLAALHHGAERVDAVEVNPAIAALMKGPRAEESGRLYHRPDVRLHVAEGRSFVRHGDARYDAIQISLVDTFAASSSGAYSLMEGYLYTVEAFQDYLARLEPDGFVTITRWLAEPPRETLKLCTVAAAALRRAGVTRPGEHIVVLGQAHVGNVVVKRSPFSPEDVARLTEVARARQFDVIHAPGLELRANPFSTYLSAADPEAFVAAYPFDISASTDDSPFFFQFGRWKDIGSLARGAGESGMLLSGRLILLLVLVQSLAASAVLVVLPMLGRRRELQEAGRGSVGVLGLFFLIGVSFMLIEITLMQRFTLFLGHPLYAIALVLAVLLCSAGAGSLAARRLLPSGGRAWPIFLALVVLILIEDLLCRAVFGHALGLGLASRLAIGVLLIAPLGFLLGMPFPAALMRLGRDSPLVGWAWAANGCASVVGPIVASLLAIDVGFSAVMAVAAAGYAAAYAVFPKWESPTA